MSLRLSSAALPAQAWPCCEPLRRLVSLSGAELTPQWAVSEKSQTSRYGQHFVEKESDFSPLSLSRRTTGSSPLCPAFKWNISLKVWVAFVCPQAACCCRCCRVHSPQRAAHRDEAQTRKGEMEQPPRSRLCSFFKGGENKRPLTEMAVARAGELSAPLPQSPVFVRWSVVADCQLQKWRHPLLYSQCSADEQAQHAARPTNPSARVAFTVSIAAPRTATLSVHLCHPRERGGGVVSLESVLLLRVCPPFAATSPGLTGCLLPWLAGWLTDWLTTVHWALHKRL